VSKKSIKRVGIGVATGGFSEQARQVKGGIGAATAAASGDLKGAVGELAGIAGVSPGKPKVPGSPVLDAEKDIDLVQEEERRKRQRRANIATKPLGALVQQALLTRTLTGQ